MKPFSETHPSLRPEKAGFRNPNCFPGEIFWGEQELQKHTLDKAVVRAAIGKTTAPKIVCASVTHSEKMWAVINERKRILHKLGLDKDGDE